MMKVEIKTEKYVLKITFFYLKLISYYEFIVGRREY